MCSGFSAINFHTNWFINLFMLKKVLMLFIDRETGKPKCYGFCEYKDEELKKI